MKQRLRDDKKHGVSGAKLSNVIWPGCYDKEAKEGDADSRSCGLCDSIWESDQLNSVGNELMGNG